MSIPGKVSIANLLKNAVAMRRIEGLKEEILRDDEKYFEDHPEIKSLIRKYLRDLLEVQPDDITQWTSEFFCQKDLRFIIKRQMTLDKDAKISSLASDLKKIPEIGPKLTQEANLAGTAIDSENPVSVESTKTSIGLENQSKETNLGK
ncbi:uncharacterized protein [Centruroides vittatus]|uniref:uncharacterized protein n=1 Tax=Centruroides vittatus TaxID=120091 RepID=UPI00350FF98C